MRKVAVQILLLLVGAQASAGTPFQPIKYDTEVLKAYAADPDAQTRDHDRAYQVVAAQMTKFFDDTLLYYMKEMNTTEAPVSVDVLNTYLAYVKTMPTSILSDVAHARHNLPFATAVLQRIGAYQYTTGKKVTVLPPPNPAEGNPNVVGVKTVADAPPPTADSGQKEVVRDLRDQIETLNQEASASKRMQYILMGVAGVSLVLALLGLARR